MTEQPLRIAMWSGPRNISTAMMRSWGNRPDTVVCDDPFYAHYLKHTELPHPGAEEVIAHHERDWPKVIQWLTGPIPEGKTIFYQKQMAHHMLPHIDLEWLDRVTNCFLIREPSEMLTSLVEFIPEPTIQDTGLPQQVQIFERVHQRSGAVPPVLDARDVLENPHAILSSLCAAVGVSFSDRMLQWPPGPRETDGIWAKHWYAKVETTTEFKPYQPKSDSLLDNLQPLLAQCRELYDKLYARRIKPDQFS